MTSTEQHTGRVLPPDVSAADFDAALAEFRRIVGDEWVADTPDAISPYEDAFPVTDDDQFTPGAVVFPDTTEEVCEIVKVANRYLIPLHAVSTGKNLGYGGSAPRTRGTIVLHLGTRMNRILEVNDRYGYALVEPGVTYFALYEHIKEHGLQPDDRRPRPCLGQHHREHDGPRCRVHAVRQPLHVEVRAGDRAARR